jgi:hypothetical protein
LETVIDTPKHQTVIDRGHGRPWTPTQRFVFRFALIYFFVDASPDLLVWLPIQSVRSAFYDVIPWYHYAPAWFKSFFPDSTGRLYHPTFWIIPPIWAAAVGLVGPSLWTLLDRRSRSYPRLNAVLRTGLRYAIIGGMFNFGLGKFGSQFWGAHTNDLLLGQPLGEWTSRALMWNAMGVSFMYSALISGVGEIAGCVLLFFRRTTTIGAMLIVFVAGTVWLLDAIMNRGGVTGSALSDTVMAIALLVPVLPRLRAFYGRNEPLPALDERPVVAARWARWLKWILVSFFLWDHATIRLHGPPSYWQTPVEQSGLFEVEGQTRNGKPVEQRWDDSTRWVHVAFGMSENRGQRVTLRGTQELPQAMYVLDADGAIREGYIVAFDTLRHQIKVDTTVRPLALNGLEHASGGAVAQPFTYEQRDRDHMRLVAIIGGDTIEVRLRRSPTSGSVLFASRRLVPGRYGKPPW